MSKIWKQKTGLSNARRAMLYPLPRLGNKGNREENSIFISEIEIKKKGKKTVQYKFFLLILPRVELVNDALEPYHCEKPARKTHQPC